MRGNGGEYFAAIKIRRPDFSDWECQMFGMGPLGFTIRPRKDEVPNWFWRKMQFLILGNRWVKLADGGNR